MDNSLIKRQAAIDALKRAKYPNKDIRDNFDSGRNAGLTYAAVIVEGLPTAHPEPCEDAVSRLEIIRNLHKYFKEGFEQDKWWNSGHVIHAIMDAPSVTPKQRTGKWIHVSEETCKCDQCGEISCCSPNFCPDCGSRNEVTE